MTTESKISSPAMVKWQLDRLIGQLVLVGDHAADTTCPCTFGYSDPTGRYASETCIPKHLLTIDAYCVETIPMIEDEKLKEILEQISSDAREIREKEIDKLCGKEVEQTDITSWSRDKRKILEPFIYSFACEIPEGEKTGMIYCCESKTKPSGETWIRCRKNGQEMDGLYPTKEDAKQEAITFCHVTEGGNPVYKAEDGWYWGSQGPFPTREKALEVSRAAFASGYKGHSSGNIEMCQGGGCEDNGESSTPDNPIEELLKEIESLKQKIELEEKSYSRSKEYERKPKVVSGYAGSAARAMQMERFRKWRQKISELKKQLRQKESELRRAMKKAHSSASGYKGSSNPGNLVEHHSLFKVKFRVKSLDKIKEREFEGLVDTASTHTVIPDKDAKELLTPAGTISYTIPGDGQKKFVSRNLYWGIVEYNGREAPMEIVSNGITVMGSLTMEALHLGVDPRESKILEFPVEGQQPTGIAGGEVLVRNLEPKLAKYEAKIRKAIVEPDELNPGKMKLVKEEKMSDNPGETLSKGGRPRKEPPPEPGKITRQLSAIPIKVDGEEIMPFLEYHCPSPSKGRCVIIPGAKGRAILACGHDIDGVSRYAREEHPNIKDAEESVIGYCKHGVPLGEVKPHIKVPTLYEPKITEIEELVK